MLDSLMKTKSITDPKEIERFPNLATIFHSLAQELPKEIAYKQGTSDLSTETLSPDGNSRRWLPVTFEASRDRVDRLASYLERCGVTKGTRVMIYSNTRSEVAEAELALNTLGAVPVFVNTTEALSQLAYIMYDADIKYVFAAREREVKAVLSLANKEVEIPAVEDRPACRVQLQAPFVVSFERVSLPPELSEYRFRVQYLGDVLKHSEIAGDLLRHLKEIARDDVAMISYTSGTTGPPKGVVVTQAQVLANIRQSLETDIWHGVRKIYHYLAYAGHALPRSMEHLSMLTEAVGIYPDVTGHSDAKPNDEQWQEMFRGIKESGAEVVAVVPKVLGRVRARIEAEIDKNWPHRRFLARFVGGCGEKLFLASQGQCELSWPKRLLYKAVTSTLGPIVFEKLKDRSVGKQFKYFISGGAKLPNSLAAYFWGRGIHVYEGYGSCESNVAIAVNTPSNMKLGTVGKPFPDVELRLTEDGELCLRGPNVSSGYLNRPQATAEAWDKEGWYHTRDFARILPSGELVLEGGRKDSIIVPEHGKNVAAEPIEQSIKELWPFITEAVLFGTARPGIVALVSVDERAFRVWADKQGISINGVVASLSAETLMWREFREKLNPRLRSFERVCNVAIIPEPSVGAGLTAVEKLQRKELEKLYKDLIDRLYERRRMDWAGSTGSNGKGVVV